MPMFLHDTQPTSSPYCLVALPFKFSTARLSRVRLQHFAALALAASLLHLNVVRADIACGTHDHAGLPDHAAGPQAVEHKDGAAPVLIHDGGPHVAANDQPCETPVQPQCCQALASCSPVFGAATESAIGHYLPPGGVALAALITLPLSLIATPDPPPPKA